MLPDRLRLLRYYVHMALPFFIAFSYLLSFSMASLPYFVRISFHMVFGIITTLMVFILTGFYCWSLFKGARMLRHIWFSRLARLLQFLLLLCFITVGVTGFLAIQFPFSPFYMIFSWNQFLLASRSLLLDVHEFLVYTGFFIVLLHAILGMGIVVLQQHQKRILRRRFIMQQMGGFHGGS